MMMLSVLLIAMGSLAGTVNSSSVQDDNRQAMEALKKQEFNKAENKIIHAIGKSPFTPELHFNLGLAFDGAGSPEKAKQAYEQALKVATTPEVRFAANYNLGELAQREKKTDEALEYYQKALAENPDSKETKTNIEILTKQDQEQKQQQQKDQDQKKDGKQNDKKDQKDQKDQSKDQDGKDKDQKQEQNKDQEKSGQHAKNKPQPKPFKSDELSPGDVKKIMDELDRQEQRVRAEYNKKQIKERPRDKDW